MSKKKSADEKNATPAVSVKYDAETLAAIALKVKAEGFVPATVLREEFGPDKTTQAIAVLYRDYHMFREVRRPWKDGDALGYEWTGQVLTKKQQERVPPELGFVIHLAAPFKAKYSDFEHVSASCRYTTPILGSVPVKDKDGETTNVFERDAAGNGLILRYHQRAMMSMALPMIGKEQALARRIAFSAIRIPINGNLRIVEHGIPPAPGMGGGGKGLRRSESLPDGIEFTIKAMVPTSAIAIDEYLRALRLGGEHIGLSPGRSAGFGDFEVLGAE